jgi:flagellar biosynthetic protein FliP
MTDPRSTRSVTARDALTDRHFWLHFLQMLIAMAVGMAVGMALLMPLGPALRGIEVQAFAMATAMTVGMAAWMVFRRHSRAAVAEMSAAMYLSFAVLLPLHWAGWLSDDGVLAVGHVLMLPAMVLAMLRRPAEYTAHRPTASG